MTQELTQIMQDEKTRREIGARIKALRNDRKWTQKQLAAQLGVRFSQVNKYECGMHVPPSEKLLQLAKCFGATVDYILTGEHLDGSPLHNLRLLERFQALENVGTEDREVVIKVIDAMIVKHKVEQALKLETQAS